jgi:creatinine amidohydrolase
MLHFVWNGMHIYQPKPARPRAFTKPLRGVGQRSRAPSGDGAVADILDSLAGTGFTRILFVNGHGGNSPGGSILQEWMNDHPGITVKWHNWWSAAKTAAAAIDPVASHGSWMENFPWTRVHGVTAPGGQKPMIDIASMRMMDAAGVRAYLGDGNFGGTYQKPDEQMLQLWRVGVEETPDALEGPWP